MGRPVGTRSKKIEKKVQALLHEFETAISEGAWDKYWTIGDMTSIVYGDDNYITPEKKAQTRYALRTAKDLLREQYGIAFFSVPGKGYRFWPDPSVLVDEAHKDATSGDAKVVLLKWLGYMKALIAPSGPIITMKNRGSLDWSTVETGVISETSERLNNLIETDYANDPSKQTQEQPIPGAQNV